VATGDGTGSDVVAVGIAPPLLDTSDDGLRAAIDADSIATRIVHPDLPHETHLDPDVAWVTGAPMDPYTNTIASAGFDPETADARIAELIAAYDALPSAFLWWRAPFHGPSDLGARLERAHIFPVGDSPAMAMELTNLGAEPDRASGFEIRGVVDEAGIRDYIEVLSAEPPGEGAPPLYDEAKATRMVEYLSPRLAAEPAPFRLVGYVRGRPVATARLSVSGGAAGLYSVATLPDHRGRGFGAAITHAALATGRDLGYVIATLQSSDMGYAIYRRLGFRELFRYAIHVHIPGGVHFAG
jgi:GNAT superfamily N-acetyltransferase